MRIHADLARLLLVAFEGVEVDATRWLTLHPGIQDRADEVGRFEPPQKRRQQLADRSQRSWFRALGTIRGELTAILHSNELVIAECELLALVHRRSYADFHRAFRGFSRSGLQHSEVDELLVRRPHGRRKHYRPLQHSHRLGV